MKLLIITQKVDVNDDNLGFFHRWLEKFSEKLEKVYVICLWQGGHNLPQNVNVFSMGKEKGVPKIGQFILLQKHLLKILPEVDGVLVHMCPIYAVAACLLVKIFRKRMILWFVHKSVNWKLKLAEKCVDRILTASGESCRLKNRQKIRVVGHGVDTELFKYNPNTTNNYPNAPNIFKILFAGRINKTKNQEILIRAVNILVNQKNFKNIELNIMGHPLVKSEKEYLDSMLKLIRNYKLEDHIKFIGGVPYSQMPYYYRELADLFVSPSSTGSLDKAVLEAMASGCLVLTCNEAYQEILDSKYLFKKRNVDDLAQKIVYLMMAGKDPNLRKIVVENHNLDNLIDKIISEF